MGTYTTLRAAQREARRWDGRPLAWGRYEYDRRSLAGIRNRIYRTHWPKDLAARHQKPRRMQMIERQKVTVDIEAGETLWVYLDGSWTSASGLVGIDGRGLGVGNYNDPGFRLGCIDPCTREYHGVSHHPTIEEAF